MTIISTIFRPLAASEASAMGLGDLPVGVVPHPVATRSKDELVEEGRGLGAFVVDSLTVPGAV